MSIAIRISISNKDIQNEYPIGVFIRPQRESISWRQKTLEQDTQVAFLKTEKIYSHDAIKLIDLIRLFNRPIDPIVRTARSSTNYVEIISTKSNLIFTTFLEKENLYGAKKPLFFGHTLFVKAKDINFIPWDKSGKQNYYYDANTNTLLSNLKNDIDIERQIYNPSFIQYRSLENTIDVKAGELITEIYRREPLYKVLNIEDIDPITFEPRSDRFVYEKEKVPGSYLYKYKVYKKNINDTVYYTEYEDQEIQLVLDQNCTLENPWELSLRGSQVKYTKSTDTSLEYTYNWDNPADTVYSPQYGYIHKKKRGFYLNEGSIYLPDKNITINKNRNLHLTFKVYRDDSVIYAASTRNSLVGKKISGNYINNNIVRYSNFIGRYDNQNGVISLGDCPPIKNTDIIIVDYFINQTNGYKRVDNLNPLHNKKIEDGFILYCVSPLVEESDEDDLNYSKLFYIKVNKVWDPAKETYNEYITQVSDFSLFEEYIGKPLSGFIEDFLVYNPFGPGPANGTFLPIGIVSFDKERYLKKVEHKDLRIYAGVKNDLEIERRGNDFAFSNILNDNNTMNALFEGEIAVYVDESEIPDYKTTDYNSLLKTALGAGFVSHFKKQGHPIIKKAECYVDPENELNVILKIITNPYLGNCNNMSVYYAKNQQYSLDDFVIAFGQETSVYPNGDLEFTFTISPESEAFVPDVSIKEQLFHKLYIYFTFGESDINYESGRSPIHCINIKE